MLAYYIKCIYQLHQESGDLVGIMNLSLTPKMVKITLNANYLSWNYSQNSKKMYINYVTTIIRIPDFIHLRPQKYLF